MNKEEFLNDLANDLKAIKQTTNPVGLGTKIRNFVDKVNIAFKSFDLNDFGYYALNAMVESAECTAYELIGGDKTVEIVAVNPLENNGDMFKVVISDRLYSFDTAIEEISALKNAIDRETEDLIKQNRPVEIHPQLSQCCTEMLQCIEAIQRNMEEWSEIPLSQPSL